MTDRVIRPAGASGSADPIVRNGNEAIQQGRGVIGAGSRIMTPGTALFPDTPRVIFARSPLVQVVCQVRFPPILRIEADPPADFQDAIRKKFPLLERRASVMQGVPPGLPPEVLQMIGAQAGANNYLFLTEDRKFSLTLAPDFISLSTQNYDRWESFRGLLEEPLDALDRIYRPAFLTRIGLRYQNALSRAQLGLDGVPWAELLVPEIAGELAQAQFEPNISEVRKSTRLKWPGHGGLFLQHGFGGEQGNDANTYVLDLDFYSERSEVAHALNILDEYHSRAGTTFRWCIKERLHASLGPRPVDNE